MHSLCACTHSLSICGVWSDTLLALTHGQATLSTRVHGTSFAAVCGKQKASTVCLFVMCITLQAIRETFSLSIDLYAIQNKERRRVMFNQDVSA